MRQIALLAAASLLSLAACSPATSDKPSQPAEETSLDQTATEKPAIDKPLPAKTELNLAGLADLRIGEAVPQGSRWQVRRPPAGEGCTTARSSEFPGVYALVEDDKVRRITAGAGATVKLAEGIGIGSTEVAAKAAFPKFSEEPHKYEDAPAKYLMTPDLKTGVSGLRLEIKADGTVGQIHVGLLPTLSYLEGCG